MMRLALCVEDSRMVPTLLLFSREVFFTYAQLHLLACCPAAIFLRIWRDPSVDPPPDITSV